MPPTRANAVVTPGPVVRTDVGNACAVCGVCVCV